LYDTNPVHTLPFYPSKIYFSIIHSSTPHVFLVVCFRQVFHQNPVVPHKTVL
jgi:hypothetical protein